MNMKIYEIRLIGTDNILYTVWFNANNPIGLTTNCGSVPTITPTPVATVTPVATATPVPTATPVAYTLADYGITVSGWSPAEEAIILEAVNDTAEALHMISSQRSNRSQADTFKIVMGITGTGQLSITKSTTQDGFCEMKNDLTLPTLTCYGTLSQPDNSTNRPYTKYVFVHELGHRFDNQSRQGSQTDSLMYWMNHPHQVPAQAPADQANRSLNVKDCDKQTVFGLFKTNEIEHWTRGRRGWGSTANEKEFSDFQQNFVDSIGIADESKDVDEAAADMFLNWVYRRLTYGPANWADECAGPTPVANEPWLGFKNITGDGSVDSTHSGNVRYWWMEQVMRLIFQTKNW
jgi:hypothetical protein